MRQGTNNNPKPALQYLAREIVNSITSNTTATPNVDVTLLNLTVPAGETWVFASLTLNLRPSVDEAAARVLLVDLRTLPTVGGLAVGGHWQIYLQLVSQVFNPVLPTQFELLEGDNIQIHVLGSGWAAGWMYNIAYSLRKFTLVS